MDPTQSEMVTMPKLGLTMKEGTVIKWSKHEGDIVKKGEIVAEIATDKVVAEVEAPTSGIVHKILVQPDSTVSVGTPIAIIKKETGNTSS